MIALSLSTVCLGLVLALMVYAGRALADLDRGRLAALVGLERARQEIWECRAVLYPSASGTDWRAPCVLISSFDGDLVLYSLRDRMLVREVLADGAIEPEVIARGVDELAVRRLGGKKPVVRIGLSCAGRIAILAARPLGSLISDQVSSGGEKTSSSRDAPESDLEDME